MEEGWGGGVVEVGWRTTDAASVGILADEPAPERPLVGLGACCRGSDRLLVTLAGSGMS